MITDNQNMLSFTMVIHRQNFLIEHINIHTITFNIYVITAMMSVKNWRKAINFSMKSLFPLRSIKKKKNHNNKFH